MISGQSTIEKSNWQALAQQTQKGVANHTSALAALAVEIMHRLCPKGTGDLDSTIRVMFVLGRNEVQVLVGGVAGKVTGKMVDYAALVNYGDADREASPFVEPTIVMVKQEAGAVEVKIYA